jgi:hypothetical protein
MKGRFEQAGWVLHMIRMFSWWDNILGRSDTDGVKLYDVYQTRTSVPQKMPEKGTPLFFVRSLIRYELTAYGVGSWRSCVHHHGVSRGFSRDVARRHERRRKGWFYNFLEFRRLFNACIRFPDFLG